MKYNGMEPEHFPAEIKIAIRLSTSTLYSPKTFNAPNMINKTKLLLLIFTKLTLPRVTI